MKAQLVLDDCRHALELAEDARTEESFRIHWVALITLLRAVGHVLRKVDAAASPTTRQSVEDLWERWKEDRSRHQIFWKFIEKERNSVLKTYELGVQAGDVQVAVQSEAATQLFALDECIYKPLLDGPYAGEDGRDVARDAIDWWQRQLSDVARASRRH